MAELRFNPLLRDWTMVAANRQNRPDRLTTGCAFCPGSGRVPEHYTVLKYDNDFPVLSPNPLPPDAGVGGLYQTAEAYGKCEVILYSPEHTITLPQLPIAHIRGLVDLWTQRMVELAKDSKHAYVLIFENRGPEVGVTMSHPHGQIYAYPFVPQKLRVELDSFQIHREQTGHCLMCDMNQEEQSGKQRMLFATEHFVCYVPFFTDFPYGAFIASRSHKGSLVEFSDPEKTDLARALKWLTAGMDQMFEREFPYMMVLHQRPVNGPQANADFHFHIEFYPPLRSRDHIKYLAASETGAWAPANPRCVEETAAELRQAIIQARQTMGVEGEDSR
ncbi:galactose-1-phosphate uridylyltransferase [Alicyclobacillaceae bacterium I2511]|nr:galactose-1-phosphate uridylyltransferase [Alicyclobacillaceae bacterium I2511]